MDDDILRQRRNLIAISTMLILFDFADVKIAKVGVLGTELIVGSPDVLIIFTWIIWAYLLLRYYQYWRRDNRSLFTQTILDAVRGYALQHSNSASFKKNHTPPNQNSIQADLIHESQWKLRYSITDYFPEQGKVIEVFSLSVPMWRAIYWKVKAALYFVIHTPHFTDHILPFTLAISAPIVTFYTKYNASLTAVLPN